MNGWWGAIGVVVMVVVGLMASSGSNYRFKSEREYVGFCVAELEDAGLSAEQSRPGCKCIYSRGRAALEARGDYELTESEAEKYFDQCMEPIVQAYEANEAWNAQGSYSSQYDQGGWGDDSGGVGWGN